VEVVDDLVTLTKVGVKKKLGNFLAIGIVFMVVVKLIQICIRFFFFFFFFGGVSLQR